MPQNLENIWVFKYTEEALTIPHSLSGTEPGRPVLAVFHLGTHGRDLKTVDQLLYPPPVAETKFVSSELEPEEPWVYILFRSHQPKEVGNPIPCKSLPLDFAFACECRIPCLKPALWGDQIRD